MTKDYRRFCFNCLYRKVSSDKTTIYCGLDAGDFDPYEYNECKVFRIRHNGMRIDD